MARIGERRLKLLDLRIALLQFDLHVLHATQIQTARVCRRGDRTHEGEAKDRAQNRHPARRGSRWHRHSLAFWPRDPLNA